MFLYRNLKFGDCEFENNAGNPEPLKFLFIFKDTCENVKQ